MSARLFYNEAIMLGFIKSDWSASLGVIVDVGAGSVASALALFREGQSIPEILAVFREPIHVKHTSTPIGRARAMKQALTDALHAASKEVPRLLTSYRIRGHVSNIYISCTAPWSQTVTQIIHFEPGHPFTITRELVDDIIRHAEERTEHAYKKGRARIGHGPEMRTVEQSIINITANGYPITDPYGHDALEIDVAYLRGLINERAIDTFENVTERAFPQSTPHPHTSALVEYCVLRDLYPKVSNALIIDISGGATELSVMHQHILYESHAVLYGVHALIRDIADTAHVLPEEATMYARSYAQNILSKKQELVLEKALKRYVTSLERVVREITARYALPRTIFIICDEDMSIFFSDACARALAEKGGHRNKTLIPVGLHNTHDLVLWREGTSPDTRIALTARFFHKLHACGEIDN